MSVIVASRSHCIGDIMHLDMFVFNPDAPAKISKIVVVINKSCCTGDRKTTISSAYMKALSVILGCKTRRSPLLSANLSRAFSPSMTITNNSGDNGSP